MATQHKITLTFLDLNTAKTIGCPLRYFARQLGLWVDRTNIESTATVRARQGVSVGLRYEYGRAQDVD